MIGDFDLIKKIKKLPPAQLLGTNDIINYLLEEKKTGKNFLKDRSGIFGIFRGQITMLPGFDDPIEGLRIYVIHALPFRHTCFNLALG